MDTRIHRLAHCIGDLQDIVRVLKAKCGGATYRHEHGCGQVFFGHPGRLRSSRPSGGVNEGKLSSQPPRPGLLEWVVLILVTRLACELPARQPSVVLRARRAMPPCASSHESRRARGSAPALCREASWFVVGVVINS